MSKKALLKIRIAICFMVSVLFLYPIPTFADTKETNKIALADNVKENWTNLAPMSVARDCFQTEVINGKIYAIGGSNLKSTEVYDPNTNSWTKLASMSDARNYFQTEVIDGKIYAIGGVGQSSIEVYDPTTDSWTKLASMSTRRFGFQTEVIDGKIYAIGGSM
ncbi:hypothetical protein DS742_05115 [Lacrimispora amygdalina]|uniref:Galactose oxidase n=1 Tax=Lacrimispora amygdalina TaxID=253257 RepID=A0A3E2NFQ2_9FIRM|nr:kelch repeat-containing protein [Clostridium indicum]RFZ79842.1 hypothetical protein DS742_05115 [Clostridium indicum]